eukprot:PhM_4_TR11507/c0_g1_i1/m.97119
MFRRGCSRPLLLQQKKGGPQQGAGLTGGPSPGSSWARNNDAFGSQPGASLGLSADAPSRPPFMHRIVDSVTGFVKRYIHDPRFDPNAAPSVSGTLRDRDFTHPPIVGAPPQATNKMKQGAQGPQAGVTNESVPRSMLTTPIRDDETIEDYIKRRHEEWSKGNLHAQRVLSQHAVKEGFKMRDDGTLFHAHATDRTLYMTADVNPEQKAKMDALATEIDPKDMEIRRHLQHENAAEFRKHVSEKKRDSLNDKEQFQRRRPHPSDQSNYNPFWRTPDYRPGDSTQLAEWLDTQRNEKGVTPMGGQDLSTPEGKMRGYQEEVMATQYNANPTSNRFDLPPGLGGQLFKLQGMSPDSVIINGKEVIGSTIVLPTGFFHWNVTTWEDINERTLALIMHTYPVPDILFIGTGRNQHFVDEDIVLALRRRGTIVHCLTTRDAAANYSQQLSGKRRVACALVMCIPTNPYKTEAFGDFVENDAFISSDSELGILPQFKLPSEYAKHNKVAEKYRHLQGTGIGPQYHMLRSGKMVRPGTAGTSLRPLSEPNEEIDFPQLPSYYNWYPKENVEDYVERTTWREVGGFKKAEQLKDPSEARIRYQREGSPKSGVAEQEEKEFQPWEGSSAIPLPKWVYEKEEDEIIIDDPKTGRMIGMTRKQFEDWLVMMKHRSEGKANMDTVEYDQEQFVAGKNGFIYDMSKLKWFKNQSHRWYRHKSARTGRGFSPMR